MFILTNSADPDETSRFAASHLGLNCLYMLLFRMHSACYASAYFEFAYEEKAYESIAILLQNRILTLRSIKIFYTVNHFSLKFDSTKTT